MYVLIKLKEILYIYWSDEKGKMGEIVRLKAYLHYGYIYLPFPFVPFVVKHPPNPWVNTFWMTPMEDKAKNPLNFLFEMHKSLDWRCNVSSWSKQVHVTAICMIIIEFWSIKNDVRMMQNLFLTMLLSTDLFNFAIWL